MHDLRPSTRHAWAATAYAALAVAFTWPLALTLPDVVPHDPGDPLLSTWALWWNARVLPLTDAWWNSPIFFPAGNAMTFSDHRLGLGFIATPIIWLGGSALTAHNLVFIASFFLSSLAAYALGFALVGHRGAAFVCGLVFGFNPFRADHLPHLELLCTYWLPIVLLALHGWAKTRRTRWLALLTVALAMQGMTSAYYFAFLAPLIGLWLLWFLPRDARPAQYAALGAALALPAAVILPIVLRYRAAHESMGLSRTIADIEHYSADLLGLLTSAPLLALWSSPAGWYRGETALYPGIVAVAVVAAGIASRRSMVAPPAEGRRLRHLRRVALAAAAIAAVAAATPAIIGPLAFEVAGVSVSLSHSYKPLSIALLFGGVWLLTTGAVREAWRRRSPLAFYTLATVAMWLFALGPTGRVLGERFLYKAPYAWLMMLPGFDTAFRVPARFGMLAALTLAAGAALAAARLLSARGTSAARALLVAIVVAVVADSWITGLPLVPAPEARALPEDVPAHAPVLELPLGTFEDAAAMYRSMAHGHPIVNGLSGYAPPHYQVLHAALTEGRADALPALPVDTPLIVLLHREAAEALGAAVAALPGAARSYQDAQSQVVLVPPAAPRRASRVDLASGMVAPAVHASHNAADVGLMSDGRRDTGWIAPTQEGGEEFTADLGAVHDVSGVLLSLGAWPGGFPRSLSIAVSDDAATWVDVWRGEVAQIALATAIADPRDVTMSLEFQSCRARYVRVRQTGRSALPWVVAEFRVRSAPMTVDAAASTGLTVAPAAPTSADMGRRCTPRAGE